MTQILKLFSNIYEHFLKVQILEGLNLYVVGINSKGRGLIEYFDNTACVCKISLMYKSVHLVKRIIGV